MDHVQVRIYHGMPCPKCKAAITENTPAVFDQHQGLFHEKCWTPAPAPEATPQPCVDQLREACEEIYQNMDVVHAWLVNNGQAQGEAMTALDSAFKALERIDPGPLPPKDKLG